MDPLESSSAPDDPQKGAGVEVDRSAALAGSPALWLWLLLGGMGGAVATGVVEWRDGPFQTSEEIRAKRIDARIQLTAEEKAEIRRVDFSNSGYVVAMFGVMVGCCLGMARGLWDRSLGRLAAGWFTAGALGLLFGASGGLASHYLFERALHVGGDIPAVRTMFMHAVTFGVTGLGIGLGTGIAQLSVAATIDDAIRAGVGGVCTGLWYVPLVSVLVPLANSEPNIPRGTWERSLWIVGTAVTIAIVLGRTAPRRVPPAPASPV